MQRIVFVLAAIVVGLSTSTGFLTCSCNFNHMECSADALCHTETDCVRSVKVLITGDDQLTDEQLLEDQQSCGGNGSLIPNCNTAKLFGDKIEVWYCCRFPSKCNGNNTALREFIYDKLGPVLLGDNSGDPPTTNATTPLTATGDSPHFTIIISLSVTLCVVLMALVITVGMGIIYKRMRNKKRQVSDLTSIRSSFDDPNGTLSGSGAGVHQLENRTIARQIKLVQSVGKGRYGEVFLGKWQSQYVAVKIFSTVDEQSWKREGMIYNTCMLNNEYILRFIAMDNRDTGIWTQLWMVFDYHPKGSLYDHLSRNSIVKEDLYKLTVSLASGLEYLHHEFKAGELQKPGIAHRDLKSRNVLVKVDSTCCIADFGLAVSYDSSKDQFDMASNDKQGTKRYMAPEVLDETFDATQFISFKQADIYSLGLMLWEIARRCDVNGRVEEYQLPYADRVPHDPSVEEMKKLVADEEYRPSIPNHWQSDEVMLMMLRVMQECWYVEPSARLTALRVKKTLQSMTSSLDWKAQTT